MVSKFQWKLFWLQRMTGLGRKTVWTMTYSHRPIGMPKWYSVHTLILCTFTFKCHKTLVCVFFFFLSSERMTVWCSPVIMCFLLLVLPAELNRSLSSETTGSQPGELKFFSIVSWLSYWGVLFNSSAPGFVCLYWKSEHTHPHTRIASRISIFDILVWFLFLLKLMILMKVHLLQNFDRNIKQISF